MNITGTLFYCFLFMCDIIPHNTEKLQIESHVLVRETAMQDFLKTKLYKNDSVFLISFYDTLHRMELKKIDERTYKWARGKTYPKIIAVGIHPYQNKFFLDTTVDISVQTTFIPSRCIELNGKLFFWFDKYNQLTNNAIKILDKHHRLRRGGPNDANEYHLVIDDSLQGIDYYFCRSNLNIYKKVIADKAMGYYNPPNINCN